AKGMTGTMRAMDEIGKRSVFSCPECNGVLWELDDGKLFRFRCHVGHAYSAEAMNLAMEDNLKNALGNALRVLDERIAITKALEQRARDRGHHRSAESWADRVREAERDSAVIRESVKVLDMAATGNGAKAGRPGK